MYVSKKSALCCAKCRPCSVCIVSGSVKVLSRDVEGREVILTFLGEGECFGEMGLIDGAPRSADVVAFDACELLGRLASEEDDILGRAVEWCALSSGSRNLPGLEAQRAVLEVYPALAKVAGKASPAREEIAASLPADVVAGTDRYDAALCALMALQYAAGGAVTSLPDLVSVPPDFPLDEGWVYHFARP